MRIIGCDLHARQQTLAMLDTATGEVVKVTLKHEGNMVREFYDNLPRPVRVGIENRALMVDSPKDILQALADTICETLGCGSAGISLLSSDGGLASYWPAISGIWKPHIGGDLR
jgi:hypothetical protein